MTSGMPFCSATWAIAVVWPESKAPIRSWAPSLISRSARARAVSTFELGVAVHNREIRQTHRLQDRRRDVDAALAVPGRRRSSDMKCRVVLFRRIGLRVSEPQISSDGRGTAWLRQLTSGPVIATQWLRMLLKWRRRRERAR